MPSSILGFEKQKEYFQELATHRRVSHAYLFSGPERIGKKSFALELSRMLNGRHVVADPDSRLLAPRRQEGETKIYIEDIRDLHSFLYLKPVLGPNKILVIDEADRLTDEASNALLKTLEDPTPNSVFILISSQPKLLLSTIRSRCLEIRFPAQSPKVVQESMVCWMGD
jgi:DNA polymerase III subunit delta'